MFYEALYLSELPIGNMLAVITLTDNFRILSELLATFLIESPKTELYREVLRNLATMCHKHDIVVDSQGFNEASHSLATVGFSRPTFITMLHKEILDNIDAESIVFNKKSDDEKVTKKHSNNFLYDTLISEVFPYCLSLSAQIARQEMNPITRCEKWNEITLAKRIKDFIKVNSSLFIEQNIAVCRDYISSESCRRIE